MAKGEPPSALEGAIVVVLGQNALTFAKVTTPMAATLRVDAFSLLTSATLLIVFASVTLNWKALRHVRHVETVYNNRLLLFDILTIATYAALGQSIYNLIGEPTGRVSGLKILVSSYFIVICFLNICWNWVEFQIRTPMAQPLVLGTIIAAQWLNLVSIAISAIVLVAEFTLVRPISTLTFAAWLIFWAGIVIFYFATPFVDDDRGAEETGSVTQQSKPMTEHAGGPA